MNRIVNENYNDCLTSQVNTEKMIPSVSSVKPTTIVENTGDNIIVEQRRHLVNLSTPNAFDHNHLKSSTPLVVPVITIGDSDSDEDHVNENNFNNDEDDVITIDSSDDEINEEEQMSRRMLNRNIRRLKYKIRRVINVILRYYREGLCDEEILHLEEKCDSLRRTNRRINRGLSAESTQLPISEDQLLRRVQTLRRRYLEAIRSAHEFSYIWSNDELNNSLNSVSEYMQCINTVILKRDNDVSVTLNPDGEIESNELDIVIQNMENSDTECSSESETSTSYNEFISAYVNQRVKKKDSRNRSILRYQRRLQRRQMLRNRFKKIHHQFYSVDDESPASSQTRHFEEKNKLGNYRDSVQNSTYSSSPCVISKKNVTVKKANIEVIEIDSSDSEPDDYLSSNELKRCHKNLLEHLRETACQTQLEHSHSLFLKNRPLLEISLSTLKNNQQDNNSSQNLPLTSTVEQVQETKTHVVETGTMTDNRYDKVEVVEPPHTNADCVNQKVNGSLGNINLREFAQTIAAATRALSSTHTEIFQGIIRMADSLYKTTVKPIAGPTEEGRPVKKDVSVETEIVDENPYIKVRQQYILSDLQQMMDAIWNLISRPISLGLVESSASALQTSIETRVRRAEQLANDIVSKQRITAQSPSSVSTSATQIFTIESQQSTRDTHPIHLSPDRLLDDYDNQSTSQLKPTPSEVRQHKQPSPPIIIITPPSNDSESSITKKLPYRRNGRQRVVETNNLSSHTNAKNLLAPPKVKVQRRSRSRTRDPLRPRRFCSPSPPGGSRVRIISKEQKRRKSRSLLAGSRSATSPPVPTTPHLSSSQLPRSSPAATITTDISASTTVTVVATETIAERPNLSPPPPPEALRSTLQPALDDDGATASLSQTAFALLELSGQSPKSDQTIDTLVVNNRTVQTTATTNTVIASAAAVDDDELMSNSDVLATFAVGGGGLARNPATKRQRSRSRSNSPSRKLKPSSSSGSEQQPNEK